MIRPYAKSGRTPRLAFTIERNPHARAERMNILPMTREDQDFWLGRSKSKPTSQWLAERNVKRPWWRWRAK